MNYRSLILTLVLMTLCIDTGSAGMRWIALNPTGDIPPGTVHNAAVYASANNRLIAFGGAVLPSGTPTNDLFLLTNANGLGGTPVWQKVPVSGDWPSPRAGSHAAYDSANDRMIVFGGLLLGGVRTNEVWVLNNASAANGTPFWTKLVSGNSPPPGRWLSRVVYEPTTNRLIVFGGAANFGLLNDIWVLTHPNGLGGVPEWFQLFPSGGSPAARCCGSAHSDPVTGRMILFGGDNSSQPKQSDTWHLLNPTGMAAPEWLLVAPVSPTPDRYNFASAYRPDTNELVVALGVSQGQLTNSVWKLENANGSGVPAWIEIFPSGSFPEPRESISQTGLDEVNGRLIVFGGSDSTGGFLHDVWVLADDSLDSTPPQIVATVTPTPNVAGWNREDVVVSFNVSDPESGIESSFGCETVSLTAETQGMMFTCSATNSAGLTESKTVTIKIDKTAPQISIVTPTDGSNFMVGADVLASYTCVDPLSGVSNCTGPIPSGSQLDTLSVGQNIRFSVAATDVAGNGATAAVNYSVSYAFLGFFPPIENYPVINAMKAGRTVPVKWQIKNASGEIVSDLTTVKSISSIATACDDAPTNALSEVALAAGGTELRFDPTSKQFVYNWQTLSSWAGCRLLQLELSDSTLHIARFRFR